MYTPHSKLHDAILVDAKRQQSEAVRTLFQKVGHSLFKVIPERLRRAYQRRRTLVALERLDERTLNDIGLAPGMLRRAAYSAADFAMDQELRGIEKPTFLTPAQAMKQAATLARKAVANSNGDKQAA